MKLVEKMLLLKPRTTVAAPVTWASYIASLALPAWWRMRDTSGVTVVNSGSLGSAVDLTATAWTMGQAGQLGPGEAGLADGATTKLTCANNATLAGYTTWEWGFLIKPSGAGEGNAGAFFYWGGGVVEPRSSYYGGGVALRADAYNTIGGEAETITTSVPSTSAYSLLFISYDNSGDRKIHFRLGISGAVSEMGYSAQGALTGTYKPPTSVLNVFNNTGQSQTFAGLADEVFVIGGRTFTPAERLQMVVLAGV